MRDAKPFNPRSDALKARDEPGKGDDLPCVKCGAKALDTGLECSECGHDNYEAVTGRPFGGKPSPVAEPACTWREPDRTGMRYPEQSDISGGATDCAPAPAVDERTLLIDGQTPHQFALSELHAFQEATGCDTAEQFVHLAAASNGSPGGALLQIGDYVLATKYGDGDPGDPWALGFYAGESGMGNDRQPSKVAPRYMVKDSAGNNIRHNGYRRVARIRKDVGRWLLEAAAPHLERCPPGTVNLWTMLTPLAFDLDMDVLRSAATSPEADGQMKKD